MSANPQTVVPQAILRHVTTAAVDAGNLIAAEFARPEGPRFSDHVTAPLDHEIELMLRRRLLDLVPARFVGEEAGVLEASTSEASANGYCWVVDPHDGTRAFLEGTRGSAVSIALLHRGVPVLGVVYAPTSPDRGPDLITWAEGGAIMRDGQAVSIDLRERELSPGEVVFLNHGAWQRPIWHGSACAPAGFMPLPSIAYRLARIAVGDGIGTLTLRPVNALDIAAGHALLMAAGGVLVAENGAPVTYNVLGESRPSACFGGAPGAVAALRARAWRGSQEPRRESRITLNWPRRVPEMSLDRAAGCLFGLAIGGDLGPETELGLIMARGLVGQQNYDKAAVDAAVGAWVAAGGRIDQASPEVRAVAIGIWARDPETAATIARQDSPGSPNNGEIAAFIASCIQAAPTRNATGPFSHDDPRPFGQNPAILAAVAGVTRGRRAFPTRQVLRILTSRPNADLGVPRPRPENCWTDDVVDVAEALLTQGQRTL